MHWHGCPECYEKYPCEMKCSIEYDLQEGDKEFGAYCICDKCAGQEKDSRGVVIFSREWWLRYHGFIK